MQHALFVLTPAEAKRLIGQGVSRLPEVKAALEKGKIIIAGGTTNAFVVEAITGRRLPRERYTAGIITDGRLCLTPPEARLKPVVLVKGEEVETGWEGALEDFGPGDVFIKGANAVDAAGMAGVLVASPTGGTIGRALGIVEARGAHLVVPVGLEKMVPSVRSAAKSCGNTLFDHSLGVPVGMIPLVYGRVVTELVALEVLTGVEAVVLACGGVGGSEGSLVIAVSGEEPEVTATLELVQGIKGEPPVPGLRQDCHGCSISCDYTEK